MAPSEDPPEEVDDGDAVGASDDDEGGAGSDSDIPSRLRDLGAFIRSQRNNAQLSLRKLAKNAGVSNPYLSQIERGLRNPSAEILQAIAKGLSISAETLYVKAGILEEREGEHDLEAMIAQDPNLTDSQRRTMIEMYRSFCQLSELRGEGEQDEVDAPATGAEAEDVDDVAGDVDADADGDADDETERAG